MTERELRDALQSAVTEVLERMFFISSLEMPAESRTTHPELLAWLTFEGAPSGVFLLRVSRHSARSIAADFLAVSAHDLTEEEVGEVVCELANMICGSVLSRVESDTTFRLAAPRILAPEQPDGAGTPPACGYRAAYCTDISGGVLIASIQTELPECQKIEEYAF